MSLAIRNNTSVRVDLSAPGGNTMIVYRYRDGDNNKVSREIVLAGRLAPDEAEGMLGALDDRQFFIPGQAGLPDLQSNLGHGAEQAEAVDHIWHELLALAHTDRPADGPEIGSVVQSWPDPGSWDVPLALDRLRTSVVPISPGLHL